MMRMLKTEAEMIMARFTGFAVMIGSKNKKKIKKDYLNFNHRIHVENIKKFKKEKFLVFNVLFCSVI